MSNAVRLLVVNPTSSMETTNSIRTALGQAYSVGMVSIDYVTAPMMAPTAVINKAGEMRSTAQTLFEMLRRDGNYDGVLVAAFGNHPLIDILREALPGRQPVVSCFEASLALATQVGHRFSILTTTPKWATILQENLSSQLALGMRRCSGIHALGIGHSLIQEDNADVAERLRAGIAQARGQGADVVILGCIPSYAEVQAQVADEFLERAAMDDGASSIAVIEPLRAGCEMLIAICHLRLKTQRDSLYAPS